MQAVSLQRCRRVVRSADEEVDIHAQVRAAPEHLRGNPRFGTAGRSACVDREPSSLGVRRAIGISIGIGVNVDGSVRFRFARGCACHCSAAGGDGR